MGALHPPVVLHSLVLKDHNQPLPRHPCHCPSARQRQPSHQSRPSFPHASQPRRVRCPLANQHTQIARRALRTGAFLGAGHAEQPKKQRPISAPCFDDGSPLHKQMRELRFRYRRAYLPLDDRLLEGLALLWLCEGSKGAGYGLGEDAPALYHPAVGASPAPVPLTALLISFGFGPASALHSTVTSAGGLNMNSPGLLIVVLAWAIVTWLAR